MKRLLIALAAMGVLAVATTGAHAQGRLLTGDDLYPWTGWYVSVFGGVRFQGDESSTITSSLSPGLSIPFEHSFNTGFTAGVALGYSWRFGGTPWALRAEGEYAYARNSVDTVSTMGDTTSANGALQSHSFMANLYVDYHWRRLVPYIGAGVGVAVMDLSATVPNVPGVEFGAGTDANFAVQAMAGIDYKILPRWRLGVAYKYQVVFGNNFDLDNNNPSMGPTGTIGNFDFGTIDSHTVLVKLSYLF